MNKSYPNFDEEKKCWNQGYNFVVGIDEVGRGPLAGPVVAAVVCFCRQKQTTAAKFKIKSLKLKVFEKIRDSKKLSFNQREGWYKILTSHHDIKWGIGIVSQKVIDRINVFEATKLAMKRALADLASRSCRNSHDRGNYDRSEGNTEPDFLLIDGNFTLEAILINQKAIVRGDEKVFSCAAASIIAKVTRDRIMRRYAKKYPQYDFEKHKGYGTKAHFAAIKKYGPCRIHRKSFKPIKDMSN